MKTYKGRFENGVYTTQNGAEVVKLLNSGIAINDIYYSKKDSKNYFTSYFEFEDTAELREILK